MCPSEVSTAINMNKALLSEDQQRDVPELLPFFTYNISVSAVNEKGEGKMAETTQTTAEEGESLSVPVLSHT